MSLPLLSAPPLSQNARVKTFAVGGDESPRRIHAPQGLDAAAIDEVIEQAYRQIFFHALKVDREPALESQLRSGAISVKDFIRGLVLSRKFMNDFYRCNSNYRLVDQIVGRLLGRPVHGEKERIALSILIAEQGLAGLADHLLDSEEYRQAFGQDTVPYQRSRVLPGRTQATSLPFNQLAPRYGAYWRDRTASRFPSGSNPWTPGFARPAWLADQPSPLARRLWQNLVAAGGFALTGLLLYIAAAMLSTANAG
jgi:phycobilisome rod-core linker protein